VREVTDTAMGTEAVIGTIDTIDLAMMTTDMIETETEEESVIGVDLTDGTIVIAMTDEGMTDTMTVPRVAKGVMMMLHPLVGDRLAMILADHLLVEAVGVPKIQPVPLTEEAQLQKVFCH